MNLEALVRVAIFAVTIDGCDPHGRGLGVTASMHAWTGVSNISIGEGILICWVEQKLLHAPVDVPLFEMSSPDTGRRSVRMFRAICAFLIGALTDRITADDSYMCDQIGHRPDVQSTPVFSQF